MKPENHVIEQLAAYALNILDAEETAEVAAHLADCAECQQALRDYQDVAGMLALATPTVTPPESLKDRLINEISQQTPTAVSPIAEPTQDSQRPWWVHLRSWFQKRPLWQPALVLALLVLLISNFQLRLQLDEAQRPAGFGTISLTGTDLAESASGIVIISADGENGTLVVQNLPILHENSDYQLWLTSNGQRISGAVFKVDEDGYKAVYLQTPDPLVSYEGFGITIEPEGGSPSPTGEKVLGN